MADLFPSIKKLNRCVKNVLQEELTNFAFVINSFNPSFLLLGGKTSSLPSIKKIISDTMILPQSKVIALSDHYIGHWYPFTTDTGKISDPKSGVVVGNAIANCSNNQALNNNIITQGEISDFTLYYLGHSTGNKLLDQNILFSHGDTSNNSSRTVQLNNHLNLVCRNVNHPNMSCSMMYEIRLNKDITNNEPLRSQGVLELTLDCSNPKENISILSVKGNVFPEGNPDGLREATIDDIDLNQKTLIDSDYYLDDGAFDFGLI